MTDPNSVMTSVSIALLKLKSKLKYKLVVFTAALFVMVENWTQLKWFTTENGQGMAYQYYKILCSLKREWDRPT